MIDYDFFFFNLLSQAQTTSAAEPYATFWEESSTTAQQPTGGTSDSFFVVFIFKRQIQFKFSENITRIVYLKSYLLELCLYVKGRHYKVLLLFFSFF